MCLGSLYLKELKSAIKFKCAQMGIIIIDVCYGLLSSRNLSFGIPPF